MSVLRAFFFLTLTKKGQKTPVRRHAFGDSKINDPKITEFLRNPYWACCSKFEPVFSRKA
jgi:hypothetical protein